MNQKKNSQDIKAKIFALADLIDYQKDSVVSRIVLKKITGNITLFAFDKDSSLSEHKAPFDAFLYLVEGKAKVIISGKNFILKQGDMIIMPANKPHSVYALENFKMALVMIKS